MWLLAIMEVSAHATDPVPSALAPFGNCKWSGTEVKIDGQELLIMKESDSVAPRCRGYPPRPRCCLA